MLAAARDQPSLPLPDLDVLEDLLLRGRAHDRTEIVLGLLRRADRHGLGADAELLHEFVVELLVHDGPRARGAFLSLESEGGRMDSRHARFQIRVLVQDHEVLPAHLEDRALEPDLPLRHLRRALVDADPDLHRAGERHEPDAWMLHQRVANRPSRTGKEIQRPRGHSRLLQNLEYLPRRQGRVAARFQDRAVPRDDGRRGHSHRDRAGEIPGRDHHPDPERNVEEVVRFAGVRYQRVRGGRPPAHHLVGVEFTEVDRLGGVAVRLEPVLPHLEHHRGVDLVTALAEEPGSAEQHVGALLGRNARPGLERLLGRGHRVVHVLDRGLREIAHAFGRVRRILALEGFLGRDPLPADHERIGRAELGSRLLERLAHPRLRVGTREIEHRRAVKLRKHGLLLTGTRAVCLYSAPS